MVAESLDGATREGLLILVSARIDEEWFGLSFNEKCSDGAQFDNDVRSDRTRAGMKAALDMGRWVFLPPIGYLNAPRSMGRSLAHDPAALVQRAFEEYATGAVHEGTPA